MDLQIAATAARHGLMLLTRNGSNFTGLQSALEIVSVRPREQPAAETALDIVRPT
jgi:hypothetical protein